jgi:hypothetical protein
MSDKKVIYHEFADIHRIKIVEYLSTQFGWDPLMVTAHTTAPIESYVKSEHPDIILQNSMLLRQAQFDYSKIGSPIPIDAGLINSLSKYELNCLSIVEDTSGWNFSYEERKRYYFDILTYWNTVIRRLKPDLIIFFTWPHTAACYPLYLLVKHYFSVDVLFLDPVPLLNNGYHLIGTSLENLHSPIVDVYKSSESISPSPQVLEYLSLVRSEKGQIPNHIRDTYQKSKKDSQGLRLKMFIHLILGTLRRGSGLKKSATAWKKNKRPIYLPSSRMNNIENFLSTEVRRRKNRRLRKYYDPYCVQPDFTKKYIYFASSYQPEAITGTNAGVYADLILALDIINSILPEDWIIYYKENPTIFNGSPWAKGSLRRDKYYYKRIDLNEKTEMISSDYDTFLLIDNAQAVVTVSGTVAWEAALRGIPSLAFGNAWYMGCESIFWIKTVEDAQTAIDKIVKGFIPDQKDLERYAAAIENVAVKDIVQRKFQENIKKCKDPDFEMIRIARSLGQMYEKLY